MALHYIIDGYNVIRKTPFLDHEKLKDAREALLRFIDTYRPQGSHNNKITVVFDGKNGFFNFHYHYDAGIVFAKGESADGHIVALVEQSPNPRNVKVVSDDRELIRCCRVRGAHGMSVREFIQTAHKKKQIKQRKMSDVCPLSFSQKRKINEELENLWLKKTKEGNESKEK